MNNNFNIDEILNIIPQGNRYSSWGIEFNPFPRSGTSNINSNDETNEKLVPVESEVYDELKRYILNALSPNELDREDRFISATIIGDYGSGKTQLLMYAKACLNKIASSHSHIKPFTIYIDNPGGTILEFIGNIISKIGEENLRKYLWNKIIESIKSSDDRKQVLKPFAPAQGLQFQEHTDLYDPYSDANTTSYKKFLDSFIRQLPANKKRLLDEALRNEIMNILYAETNDSVVSYYFYEFISSDFGINKTWEAITNGNLKQIAGKEFAVIKYIIHLLKQEGFTDVFILVDEFEDITEGRLNKSQLDNYIHNLRTLLDKQREWCLLFAMTPHALLKLKSISPPLADRISTRKLELQSLNTEEAKKVISNYLLLAGNAEINPFDDSAIGYIKDKSEGNIRRFLKIAFALLEAASQSGILTIDETFARENFPSI